MTAQPIHAEDPRDPETIVRDLPERERPAFLKQYHDAALVASDDLAGYKRLQRLLEMWRVRADVLATVLQQRPAYYEEVAAAHRAVRDGTTQTIPIEDAFPDWDERVAAARARQE